MAKATQSKKSTKTRTSNPTLHGLLIARTFSGTVVRVLTFAILVFAVSFVGVAADDGYSGLSALGLWALISFAYFVFDSVYVLMALIRPLHPRLDRVVLPLGLIFSLIVIFTPLVFAGGGLSIANLWATSAVILICVLGARLAVLIRSLR